jgi:predicted GNAT family acetyltransferase
MATSAADQVSVNNTPDHQRFEAEIDNSLVGFAEYRLDGGSITFTHTEVHDDAEGKGVGSALAKAALDDARARGLRVIPRCRFIASYISRHAEYLDLVDEAHRDLVSDDE